MSLSELTPSVKTTAGRALLLVGAVAAIALAALLSWRGIQERQSKIDEAVVESRAELVESYQLARERLAETGQGFDRVGRALVSDVTSRVVTDDAAFGELVATTDLAGMQPMAVAVIYQNRLGSLFVSNPDGSVSPDKFVERYDPLKLINQADVFETQLDADPEPWLLIFPSGNRNWVTLVVDANALASNVLGETPGNTIGELSANPPDNTSPELVIADGFGSAVGRAPFLGGDVKLSVRTPLETSIPGYLGIILRGLAVLAAAAVALLVRSRIPRHERKADGPDDASLDEPTGPEPAVGFEQTIVGVAELDAAGVIVAANSTFASQVGMPRHQLIGRTIISVVLPSDRGRYLEALDPLLTQTSSHAQIEHRVDRADHEIWVLHHLARTNSEDGPRLLVQSQDITARRNAAWKLARQALHDDLTKLPNRAMLLHRLKAALSASTRTNSIVGVMFIDIDRFKIVNDSLGHDVGDELIQHIATNMSTAVRGGDTVSRFGGDEFVVLCDNLEGESEAVAVAERIRRSVADPFTSDGSTIHQTLSIGIALCSGGGQGADEMLRDADAAMYRAKDLGRDRIEVFDEGMREKLLERMTLETELRSAIDNNGMSMHFQSIVDSQSYATAGFESLIRWQHPDRGLLTPGQFLPVAEEAGLQGQLDRLALRQTCEIMAKWAKLYPAASGLYVSSNTVPQHFNQFAVQIEEVLAQTGLEPHRLLVEVVENALIDNADGALATIKTLKAMGVRVAIDDFGTGYSSLSYLTQFQPDVLKIDRAFVMKLPEDKNTAAVVQAIATMAKALDIKVIGEGVETWEQADTLASMGVPLFQGYLFAKPRPATEIEEWLSTSDTLGPEPNSPIDVQVPDSIAELDPA